MSATLAIYHSLPPSLRSLAASLRGAQLNSIRYGTDSERWIEQAHEREYWSAQRWAEWQRTRLDFILDRARTSVPFYRDFWRQWPGADAAQASRDLHNWPVLEKESLRKHPERFVADDVDPRALVKDHTSGTTGTPLSLSFSRETVRQWYALFDARTRRWHGVKPGSHWAILGGQLVVPIETRRPPFWVWNAAMNQLYMSSYHLSPELIPTYLEAIEEHRITYLIGYTSSLYALAEYAPNLSTTINDARFVRPSDAHFAKRMG
jgi:phenylacetate-CoA ligase